MDDIAFQIVSWHCNDEFYDENLKCSRYLIKIFGVTELGKSVCLNVLNFTPYFYVKVPKITQNIENKFEEFLRTKTIDSLVQAKLFKRKDFWGFQNGEKSNFLRFTFYNIMQFKKALRLFQKEIIVQGVNGTPVKYKLYESNIEPFIRMMHLRNIDPSGWISVNNKYYDTSRESIVPSTCEIDIECPWTYVNKCEVEKIAPILIASFDIECSSSHGDFPVPIKDYQKVCNELYQLYVSNIDIECSELVEELTNIFDHAAVGRLSKVFPKKKVDVPKIKKRIQVAIDDILVILKGKNIAYKIDKEATTENLKRDEILTKLHEKFYGKTETDDKGKPIDHIPGIFPELFGDTITQIGTTMNRYGETECNYKHILTLGTCDDIDGVVVETCKTESQLLLKWRDMIVEKDPDIITGYNILGFDVEYMYKRSIELGIQDDFCRYGRLEDTKGRYIEQKLASSALGDNLLKYIDAPGRVYIDVMKVVQRDHKLDSYKLDAVANHFMKLNKNDVTPNEIFALFKGTSSDRKRLAEYCVQDCALCNQLVAKLEILANNIGMSNVCCVPLSYIFLRGQGIKIFSLVAKQCKEDQFLIPSLARPWGEEIEELDEGYEGAIVLEPKTGIYVDDPVSVLDYASLYPSSMISENLSHDSIVLDKKYDNLPGIEYLDIEYDIYEGKADKKNKVGIKTCRFAQFPNGEKGVIPRILQNLLKNRKITRKKAEYKTVITVDGRIHIGLCVSNNDTFTITDFSSKISVHVEKSEISSVKDTYDNFQKAVLDGLQLAFKITANSLYGQTGSRVSPIFMKEIAACTTATGRNLILEAKTFMQEKYDAEIVYGDTDSIFVIFPNESKGKKAIKATIETSQKASNEFKKCLKPPHDLEYEKIYYPLLLFSKKRYAANKYEFDDEHCKFNSMGIVTKRRDNAPIVKIIYGGILDIILNRQNIPASIEFLQTTLQDIVDGKYSLESFVVSKTLKSTYADPTKIAHKALATRMAERDAGSAPQVNDRVPYAYVEIKSKKKNILQGDRIEDPTYIRKHNLKIDYEFYILNQIMKPCLQLYALVLEDLQGFRLGRDYYPKLYEKILIEKKGDVSKTKDRYNDLREAHVKKLLFDPLLHKITNKKNNSREITEFFKIK